MDIGGLIASLLGAGAISMVAVCGVGLLVLVVAGLVIAGLVWGFKKGRVRVVTGERNFDDFHH